MNCFIFIFMITLTVVTSNPVYDLSYKEIVDLVNSCNSLKEENEKFKDTITQIQMLISALSTSGSTTPKLTTPEPTTTTLIDEERNLAEVKAEVGNYSDLADRITRLENKIQMLTVASCTPKTSTTSESTTQEPTTSESTTPEPTTQEPTTPESSTTSESTTQESTTPEPTTQESTTSESTTQESTTSESTTPEPTTTEPTTLEPTTQEPITPEPPTTSESTTSESTTPEPTTPEPTTPESTTPEPTLTDEERIAHCGLISSIKDESITASSIWDNYHQYYGTQHSRLNSVSGYGGWLAHRPYKGSWIEIDMRTKKTVKGIATQGRSLYSHYWVKSFTIGFKTSTSSSFQNIQDQSGAKKIFQGNTDGNSVVINDVDVEARIIRIYPLTWKYGPILRFDVLLC